MRQNLVPGLVLQLVALTLAVSYGYCDLFRSWLDVVGETKRQFGYAFSALSTAVFGGVIPYAVLLFTGRLGAKRRVPVLVFYVAFWLWKGVEVDAFYRVQAFLFGDDATVGIVAKKALVDQFVYNPLWAGPTQVLFFLWKDSDFALGRMKVHLAAVSLLRRVIIVLVSSWIVWIPTVAIVYALPTSLQIPLFNLVICFWCLLLTSVADSRS
jgi:hypothetical protein